MGMCPPQHTEEGVVHELPDYVTVIQAADQGGVVSREAGVALLAHVGIHVGALEERTVVERDGLALEPARTDAVEAREEAGAASFERGDRIGLEAADRVG